MKLEFSDKQLQLMLWWKDKRTANCSGIIAEGAVRSGKTIAVIFGFLLWAMSNYKNMNFALCSKSIQTFKRNILSPMIDICSHLGYNMIYKRSDSMCIITDSSGRVNYFYVYGGNDEGSQDKIQGVTLAGLLLDEAALMPESFVNQALARLSITGAKYWVTCNPGAPTHFVKQRFIDNYQKRKLMIMHFTMDDNLSLSEERREFYKMQYEGIFYRRFILGEWCLADGLIYTAFNRDKHIFRGAISFSNYESLIVGADYGIQNPTAFIMIGFNTKENRLEVIKDFSYSGRDSGKQKTDVELYEDLKAFVQDAPVQYIYADPSATSFHAYIRKKGMYFNRHADNDVLPGILFTSQLFTLGQLYIHESCKSLLLELETYAWDSEKSEKEGRDIPLKVSDHSCDALRYAVYSYYKPRAQALRLGYYA